MSLEQRRREAARRLKESEASRLWSRLTAVDFFGNAFQLAALSILCFFPFLIVITAAAGENAAVVLVGWLGLNEEAARAVATLFKPGQISGTLTLPSAFLMILGALAVAGTLQTWYRRVFDVPGRGWRDVAAQGYWVAALLAYGAAQAAGGRALGTVGGVVLQGLFGFVLAMCFWWGSMRVLLAGDVRWRALFPPALATGVCWVGLGAFSARYFSAAIVANEASYGPIGVVMIILSWLVAVGVVVHLGSVVGCMYLERRARKGPTDGTDSHRRPSDG
ncbi:hypothetical protein GCM10020367_14250 [Streptomyces sannanensis]|uniref:Uncharacterized protein n=1 Tax=Streptomyces sannanensis TaxID=285536 RepID=A0ABP6S7H0_9ACTN